MTTSDPPQIPDRFEGLQRLASGPEALRTIVVPVSSGLRLVDDAYDDMQSSGIGAFRILRAPSGGGKSTLLRTLDLFKEVQLVLLSSAESVRQALEDLPESKDKLRVVVIEDRELLGKVAEEELLEDLHKINWFIRSDRGFRTLVVWPCGADPLADRLVEIGGTIGGGALLGPGSPVFDYPGPPRDAYVSIARRTIETLNAGASLIDQGISEQQAQELADQAQTIGQFLELLRTEARRNRSALSHRVPDREVPRVWVVVLGSNDPADEVAGLTRGAFSHADIDRLLHATEGNVVQDLKEQPERVGLLATFFDARIIHLPVTTAHAVVRDHADDKLRELLKQKTFSVSGQGDGAQLVKEGDLGRAFLGHPLGTKKPGPKIGTNTVEAYKKLTAIAKDNDQALNRTLGEALRTAGLIDEYETEAEYGVERTLRSDLVCRGQGQVIRLELMWYKDPKRGVIANYVLRKLHSYGRTVGYLSP